MSNRIIEEAYESIRSYVPPDAQKLLNDQAKKVEKYIDAELDKFASELESHVLGQFDDAMAKAEKDLNETHERLQACIEIVENDLAEGDEVLAAAVNELKASLAAYESRFESLGIAARTAVSGALKAAGLPGVG